MARRVESMSIVPTATARDARQHVSLPGSRGPVGPAPIAQLAEAADLKSAQCRFESDWGHAMVAGSWIGDLNHAPGGLGCMPRMTHRPPRGLNHAHPGLGDEPRSTAAVTSRALVGTGHAWSLGVSGRPAPAGYEARCTGWVSSAAIIDRREA
jgi:hypothetical protein